MRISDWSSDVCSSDLGLGHPGAQHLEQARHHDHDRRAHLFDIGRELFEAFGIIDLPADADWKILPAAVLIGMAEREEGQEHLVVFAAIFGDDSEEPPAILEDVAVVMETGNATG